jgi:excinuclease ABC subunit C
MVPQISDVDYLETGSEVEALLTEQRLIKDISPKYNTDLKDDKTFPSLEITLGDDFPALHFVRQLNNTDSAYYGPFTDTTALRRSIKTLQKIFRFRTCNLKIMRGDRSRRYARPCLLYHISRCTAPCTENISFTDYAKDIGRLISFLDERSEDVIEELRTRMSDAASRLEFEQAARYKKQIAALKTLDESCGTGDLDDLDIGPVSPESGVDDLKDRLDLKNPPHVIEGIDISTISGKHAAGSKVVFIDGIPFKGGYRRYRIKVSERDDYKMTAEVVRRRFTSAVKKEEDLPDLLLIDGGLGHVNEAATVLRELGIDIPCVGLAKKEEEIFLPGKKKPIRLAGNDSALRMLQCVRDEAHRFALRYHHLLRKKTLKKTPKG